MCDFSLQSVRSRPAKVGDRLVTRDFGTGTRGFADAEELGTAVCLLPGTELAFAGEVACLPLHVQAAGELCPAGYLLPRRYPAAESSHGSFSRARRRGGLDPSSVSFYGILCGFRSSFHAHLGRVVLE